MTVSIGKAPCKACGSVDNVSLFKDGTSEVVKGKCWTPGCNKFYSDYYGDDEMEVPKSQPVQQTQMTIEDLPFRTHSKRKVSNKICEMFGVRSAINSDGEVSETYYPYLGSNGTSYKIRKYPKDFRVKGGLDNIQLFGQGTFAGASRKRVVVTEGEEDALAVAQAYQEYNGIIYPVVSIPSASNLLPVTSNRDWLREFDEVILYIDNDDAGKEAITKLAKIIGYEKIKIAQRQYKDASDELINEGHRAVLSAIWNAKQYNPQGIMTSDSLWKALEDYDKIESIPYPPCFDGLNEKLRGMRAGEITLWTSGTGSGKSTMLREIVFNLLETTKDKIGIISLEESPAETAKKMSAMALNRNPTDDIPLEELKNGFDKIFSGDRILVLDHAGAITDGIIEQLNYMAAVGCKYLFIDHITILVSEGAEGLTGNEAIDKIMNDLLRVAKTHGVWIGLVSHLRKTSGGKSFEEGELPSLDDIKGSGSIKQISMDIVAFARDSGNADPTLRNTIDMKVLKCRYTGLTGPAGQAYYEHTTGRIKSINTEF